MRWFCVGRWVSVGVVSIGVGAVGGCADEIESTDSSGHGLDGGPAMAATGVLLRAEGSTTLTDAEGRNFDVVWGSNPYTGRACSGSIDSATCKINLTNGYVYIAGTLEPPVPPVPPSSPPAAQPLRVFWPVVITNYIEAAGDGTVLIVDIDAGKESVYRLVGNYQGDVRVKVPNVVPVILTGGADHVSVTTTPGGSPGAGAPPSGDAASFVEYVLSNAKARGKRIPRDPVSP